ncbi:alpha/beta hydrolase family protein [Aestuariibacter salexigens]|uniref:alpha/beta hydrolase family protein n=1 Tax=Aestuariibacter salexigens TaxID=226010 RepID=UPI0004183716|nr:alpha/beta hydrolase [Aestuariibacter salexigens]
MKIQFFLAVVLLTASTFAFSDSSQRHNKEHPKYSAELTINSNGSRLPAIFYGAEGKGPHPTILLLHGYPGNEKNLDIAQGMRDAGWNVLFFHYRGAWGAEGEFSFINAENDVSSATKFLQREEIISTYRVDPEHISYVGHSMGGHMAISGLFENPEVKCGVVYDNANIAVSFQNPDKKIKEMWDSYADTLYMLRGWSRERATEELASKGERLNLINRVHKIGQRPILFIPADSEVIPIREINALANAMRKIEGNKVHYTLVKDDHSFNNQRDKILSITRDFLNSECR